MGDLRKITNIINKFNKHQFKIHKYININIPNYCWLKPDRKALELTEEDKLRQKKKQEQDDEEYAFNLSMKQLLHHESMQNASASHLNHIQHKKQIQIIMTQNTHCHTRSGCNLMISCFLRTRPQ